MRNIVAGLLIVFAPSVSSAQKIAFADLTLAGGPSQVTGSVALVWEFSEGKQQRFIWGGGIRFSSYFGYDQHYVTAPAALTSGGTGPLVIFKENIIANMDSFRVSKSQLNALNLLVVLGYSISDRWRVNFNIDAIGVSFGKEKSGTYINGATSSTVTASPTAFNLLLVSDNDLGSLNSELVARYVSDKRWGIKAGLQFLFTEYTTTSKIQQVPQPNDRFRRKSLMPCVGISYLPGRQK